MLLNARRSYIRYLLICALLIAVYLLILPWDQDASSTLSQKYTQQQFDGNKQEAINNEKQDAEMKQKFNEQLNQDIIVGQPSSTNKQSAEKEGSGIDASKVYKAIFDIYERHWPDVGKLENYKDGKKAERKAFEQKLPIYSNKELGEFLQVDKSDLDKLKKSHQDTLRDLPSEYPEGLYKGQGIVTVAGGALMPVLVSTMRMLRRVSPHIPVEVFMADDEEYEPEICENVLPALNVKCRILKREFGDEQWTRFQSKGYQLKVLSMLASSFEDNLFLDADSIPLHDVEELFDNEPYTGTGFVVWPDFWFRTTSPHFYDIAGIKLGDRVRGDLTEKDPDQIPQADLDGALPDKSTESGQIMFNKKKHWKALLLATYYNIHGRIYYPLFTQGVSGEGDKETFLAALEVLGEKYHQIKTDTRPAGYFDEKNEFHGTGMLQASPIDDYQVHTLESTRANSRIKFMHLNYPKVNPRDLFFSDIFAKYYENDDSRIRFYGKPSGNYWVFDYKDIELQIWQEHEWMACEMGLKEHLKFKDWVKNDIDIADLCERTKKHVSWLRATHDT